MKQGKSFFSKHSLARLIPLPLIILLFALIASGCGQKTVHTKTGIFFDTVISITVYDAPNGEQILEGCFDLAKQCENTYSATLIGSEIYAINHAGAQPVTVSDGTISLIEKSLEYATLTDGLLDPTILPLSQLWAVSDQSLKEEPEIPSDDAIREALSHVDYHGIQIEGNTITLKDPEAGIDLGCIAKGYIADEMKSYLESQGINSALINLGGNVLCLGAKPNGDAFRVGIQQPFGAQGEVLTTIELSDRSLVSSGSYARCFVKDGKLYHHILDPRTGYPAETGLDQVTILSDSSMDGDVLSTACFLLGADKGIALIESLDHTEALFVQTDGTRISSSGFPKGEEAPYGK